MMGEYEITLSDMLNTVNRKLSNMFVLLLFFFRLYIK